MVRDIRVLPFIEVTCIPDSTLKTVGILQFLTEADGSPKRKTRQKAGFSRVPEILKAFSGTLYGAGTKSRTRDLLITSQLLYQLSYTGICGAHYIDKLR
ncbi:conserved protein of unknown function [Pseudomonas marincola]|uniref:Uncharacterized protein n=1 Tax=Pseudomonas marincola TaxID=437900 RepID=A0A653E4R7_9PSED|nr:conserved protein of unknown function [Pseudomonas marincola]